VVAPWCGGKASRFCSRGKFCRHLRLKRRR